MHSDVPFQIPWPWEFSATLGADVRPLSSMPSHVVVQRTQPHEPLLADVARVGRLRVVGAQVDVERACVAELLLTDGTRERPLVGVNAHVWPQSAGAAELLRADETDVTCSNRLHTTQTETNFSSTVQQSTRWCPVCSTTRNISSETENTFILAIIPRRCFSTASP